MRPSQYNSIKATIKPLRKKRCKNPTCRKEFQPQRPLQAVCNFKCGMEWVKILDEKRERKETIEKKKELNAPKLLMEKIQEIARLIDANLPCLARGNYANQYHGGHIFSKGSNSSMKMNLHNLHRQSAQSNHFQADDVLMREGLEREYGKDYLTFVSELRRTPRLKFTSKQYVDFLTTARKISNRLKKESKTYSAKERIELRNKINLELNIYDKEFCVFHQPLTDKLKEK